MKNLIFTIATALLTMVNANAENFADTNETHGRSKVNDTAVVRPVSVTEESQSVLEVIAQDLKITEATVEVSSPLLPGKSLAEVIADDNLVIEGNATKEIYPLDFKKINAVDKKGKKRPIKKSSDRLVGSL